VSGALVIQPLGSAFLDEGLDDLRTSLEDSSRRACWVETTIGIGHRLAVLVAQRHLALGVGAERLSAPDLRASAISRRILWE
jgi:hypothetical protein